MSLRNKFDESIKDDSKSLMTFGFCLLCQPSCYRCTEVAFCQPLLYVYMLIINKVDIGTHARFTDWSRITPTQKTNS